MPLIADPGFELARAAHDAGCPVTCAPCPSAVTTALALGGLGTDRFFFAGFLPNTSSARRKALGDLMHIDATLVFYESPKRLAATIKDARATLGNREARICRELTKKFEEIRGGSLDDLSRGVAQDPPRGEIVLLIERPAETVATPESIETALRAAMQEMSVKDAAKYVAEATGSPKRDVYQLALSLKD